MESILPVFAGMVPIDAAAGPLPVYSPRIRGDGPSSKARVISGGRFSPYSRGWSLGCLYRRQDLPILPVFAGMVRD